EFANVRQEMREEIASVRQEMREEIASVRQEMREEIASVRQEMREGFERVDRELERLGTQTKKNTDDIAELKGISLEQKYRDQARSWFSKYLRKARVVDLMDLEELLPENQSFTEQDREELSGTDLFLIGLDKRDGRECVYVVEISWVVDASDVERAARRAQILSQYGLLTAAMSAGRELTEGARDLAQQIGCGLLVGTRFEAEPALLA
ncbi:MAG: hypothetical protein RMK45_09775, partial [Armatimonadota bacterium]|nr:hypothetical protein [Armatimonadota bacterium]